jgi:putative transposase
METQRRKFSTEQKIQILKHASANGVTKTLQENRLSYSVFSRWKQQLEPGKKYISRPHRNSINNIALLESENLRLKKIVANLALELEMKSEQIKRMERIIAQF